ncbi:hypothetical protein [Candidatus Williamhamiltonella defendens]|uniref:hypothetical protein n=1 Tax=Candidatus Williamhamiltonella defendens TaxID=138072 RepID=UPI00130E635B|nr:hypothetical protein [Candidatus Hamiltonella defensa]
MRLRHPLCCCGDGSLRVIGILCKNMHGFFPPIMTIKIKIDRTGLHATDIVRLTERCTRRITVTVPYTSDGIDRHTGLLLISEVAVPQSQPLPVHHLIVHCENDVVRICMHKYMIGHLVCEPRITRFAQAIGNANPLYRWRVQGFPALAKRCLHQIVQAAGVQASVDLDFNKSLAELANSLT